MMFLKSCRLKREEVQNFSVYPFSIPTIHHLDTLALDQTVTFFVGENGSGKSTLLEAIADQVGFHTAGGSRQNVRAYNVHASESYLGDYLRLSWMPKVTDGFFLRAETFYQFASHIDEVDEDGFKSYGGKSLHHQSHGESFLSLFQHRFREKAIYLLDEPEAALSPAKQLTLLRVLHDLEKEQNVQFIIATHSPILLGYPNAKIYEFDETIHEVAYEETSHVQISTYFLRNREKMLEELFKEE